MLETKIENEILRSQEKLFLLGIILVAIPWAVIIYAITVTGFSLTMILIILFLILLTFFGINNAWKYSHVIFTKNSVVLNWLSGVVVIPWKDISLIEVGDTYIDIMAQNRRYRINSVFFSNRDDLMRVLKHYSDNVVGRPGRGTHIRL